MLPFDGIYAADENDHPQFQALLAPDNDEIARLTATLAHAGTCYRAANWLLVGYTKGRGKLDRQFKATLSKKAVLLYPLTKDATRRLRA